MNFSLRTFKLFENLKMRKYVPQEGKGWHPKPGDLVHITLKGINTTARFNDASHTIPHGEPDKATAETFKITGLPEW